MSTAPTLNLTELLPGIWKGLEQGVNDAKHPYHTPVFGTLSPRGVSLRTVVLRGCNSSERLLMCHTDLRTDKVAEIEKSPAVSWLFFSPELKIQIRAEGLATVYHDYRIARAAWEYSTLSSRRSYCAVRSPGTLTEVPDTGLPEELVNRSPTMEESEEGWPNFAVIITTITRLEWLYMDAWGNRRARFEWNGEGFTGSWVIP